LSPVSVSSMSSSASSFSSASSLILCSPQMLGRSLSEP
jgi:hypothetical protein